MHHQAAAWVLETNVSVPYKHSKDQPHKIVKHPLSLSLMRTNTGSQRASAGPGANELSRPLLTVTVNYFPSQ